MVSATQMHGAEWCDAVIDSMDQGVLVVAADLTVPILNRRACELIDLPLDFARYPPSFPDILDYQVKTGAITRAYMESSINEFILRGESLQETHTYTRKTATGRWLDVRTTPLPAGGFVRTFTDQTERETIAAAKRLSENAYRQLFDNAAIGIYRSSADGEQLRANPELVALNGYFSEEDMLQAVKDIATEWYVDPDRRRQFKETLARDGRVTEFESEVYRHLTRERIWISESAWVVRDSGGNITGYEGTVVEITARKRMEKLINHAAHHDALTGLPNRTSYVERIDTFLSRQRDFHLAYLDLDKFKPVNDTFGHRAGDRLLKAIAGRLTSVLREGNTVFRIGGDEFAILLPDHDTEDVRAALERVIQAVDAPFSLGEHRAQVGVSIGVAAARPGEDGGDLLHRADLALYRAKELPNSAYLFEATEEEDVQQPHPTGRPPIPPLDSDARCG